MRIKLHDIPQGHSRLERPVPAEGLDLASWIVARTGVDVGLDVDRRNQQVTLRGKLRLGATAACDRCLVEFAYDLEADLLVLADRRGSDAPADEDALEQEGSVLYHDGLELDLAGSIREAIILEVPQVVLCKPECRGLCHECGRNLNESACECTPATGDPRWQALSSLKAEEPGARR